MNKEFQSEGAFTLLEMLITLMIISILITLSVPVLFNTLVIQEEKNFLKMFESDVLLLQNQSLGSVNLNRILLKDDRYTVMLKNGDEKIEFEREYPKYLTKRESGIRKIIFYQSGTIAEPGTIVFRGKDKTYKIVFPLGKGRYRLDEE